MSSSLKFPIEILAKTMLNMYHRYMFLTRGLLRLSKGSR
jgi:hypothetical protein